MLPASSSFENQRAALFVKQAGFKLEHFLGRLEIIDGLALDDEELAGLFVGNVILPDILQHDVLDLGRFLGLLRALAGRRAGRGGLGGVGSGSGRLGRVEGRGGIGGRRLGAVLSRFLAGHEVKEIHGGQGRRQKSDQDAAEEQNPFASFF